MAEDTEKMVDFGGKVENQPKHNNLFSEKKRTPGPNCPPDLVDRGICAVEPCNADLCYEQPRVVIVGAGLAGLSAGARLCQRGITNIVVLEAYERPGGRIHSSWLGDVVAELGANLKPGNPTTHPVTKLAATEVPPRPGSPGAAHTRGLFTRYLAGRLAFPPTLTAYYKFRQIEQEAAQIYCYGGSKQQGSLMNFMSLRIQQELHEYPEEQQHDAARIMFGLSHMLNVRGGYDKLMVKADSLGCYMNMPGGEVRVPLGHVGMLAPLLRTMPEGCVKYSKPVTCIYWGTSQKLGPRAIVYTIDGDEYPADYVIVTFSLGVLMLHSSKLFCPALPFSKIEAMRRLDVGHCNKIYLEYLRPFWFWHKGIIDFHSPEDFSGRLDWTRGITELEVVPNSKHVLGIRVAGQEAAMMEGLCDKDVAEGVTELLRSLTGNCDIPYPKTILRSNWTSDPFFCCAFSKENVSSNGEAQREMASPLPGPSDPVPPVLLFAGEATVPGYFGSVAGARLSGVREAERINSLTLQYKGPPLPRTEKPKPSSKKKKEDDSSTKK